MANEIKNFPSIENADNVIPDWWTNSDGNAALTEVDLAGEGITEKYERALKLVVTTAPSYASQLYTYANEPRLKSGKTYSVAIDVWAVGSVEARIRLQSSVGSLGVSSSTLAVWTRVEVEAVALDGSTLELRLEGDVGTMYFVPLGLIEGIESPITQLFPRPERWKACDTVNVLADQAGAADPNTWTDVVCTSVTSPNATKILARVAFRETASTYTFDFRRNGSSKALVEATSSIYAAALVFGAGQPQDFRGALIIPLDANNIFEYIVDRIGGSNALDRLAISIDGWWEWA